MRNTICLVAIVKTEEKTIKRMLDSVVDWIDHWLIIDTGSKDHTKTVIKKYFAKHEIPGELLSEPWENFAVNRTSAVQKAREAGCDYLLLMDADCTLEAHTGDFTDLSADSYLIDIPSPQMSYQMPYLVSSKTNWRYESPTHEFITADGPFLQERHPSLIIFHYGDGGTRPEKFDRDKALLEKEYVKDPTNQRTVFYLAETYKNSGDHDGALRLYRQRVELGGWDEEVFYAYLQIARITDQTDDFIRSHRFRSSRPEPIQKLMRRFNELMAHDLSLALWKNTITEPSADLLFVERWCESYGIPFEGAIALWWTGHKNEAKAIFTHLLTLPDMPKDYRELCEHNLTFCETDD